MIAELERSKTVFDINVHAKQICIIELLNEKKQKNLLFMNIAEYLQTPTMDVSTVIR